MHRIDRSVLLPYPRENLFTLVQDVPSYPAFLPWCPSAHAWPESAPGVHDAQVDIGFKGIRAHFKTRNTHLAPDRITLELVDGPFRQLRGAWHFQALAPDACKVSLTLEYQFATGLLGRAIAPVFGHIAESLIDAFAQRAEQLYGQEGP
jgi:ribosome-associated toxin RatA of RatAB toxin-antitoxin module